MTLVFVSLKLDGVEIDLAEQLSINSMRWEAGVDVEGSGYGKEADD